MRADDKVPIAKNPWHAVEIVPPRESCIAAQAVKGMRFCPRRRPCCRLSGFSNVESVGAQAVLWIP